VIDKGRTGGISKDMAVITPRGLIGKVTMVTDNYAYVLLVNDINFSAAVRIQETRKEAILSGAEKKCVLKYVSHEETVREGNIIVTSGLDDLFPQDLVVGYISKVSGKDTGIFKVIEVAPFQDLTKLDEVVVVRR
jgi:rod shape-determining protein MreC